MTDATRRGGAGQHARDWQTATVRRGPGGAIYLAFPDPAACRRCARGEGCGAAPLSRLFVRAGATLPLDPRCGLRVGDEVRVGVDRRWLLAAAFAAYLLPVLGFVVAAAIAYGLWPGDDVAGLALGLAGAAASFWLLKGPLDRIAKPDLVFLRRGESEPGVLESADHGAYVGWQEFIDPRRASKYTGPEPSDCRQHSDERKWSE